MYSYDVAPTTRPLVGRTIPGMRPSYDADRSTSPTPIYDALYSEYRRLFRALPGDRTDEEQLRFVGFGGSGGRSGFAGCGASVVYPQHQVFETCPGHAQGTPQFVSETRPAADSGGRTHGAEHQQGRLAVSEAAGHPTGYTVGQSVGGTGQGWVAAGYLGHQTGTVAAPATGRHRLLLSLPPGRPAEHGF
ncbi:hypothetical protein [Kitasatospora sp. NPDC051914]|uniref:hypothetical protein n=1 Tax=Kitasatospora sp. NPDC051914 TaxID=3154945 RepID=UPI0034181FC9